MTLEIFLKKFLNKLKIKKIKKNFLRGAIDRTEIKKVEGKEERVVSVDERRYN